MNFKIFILQEVPNEVIIVDRCFTNIFIPKGLIDDDPVEVYNILHDVINRDNNKAIVIIGSDEAMEIISSWVVLE